MGCDIHIHMETRESPNHPWEDSAGDFPCWGDEISEAPFDWRSYCMFSFLAGVRSNGGPCISKPRGIPTDASPEVQAEKERWDGDGHSHSWLTLEELLAFDYLDEELTDEDHIGQNFLGEQYEKNLLKMLEYGEPNNVRIVFWFDN
jgi:hypothetical protein